MAEILRRMSSSGSCATSLAGRYVTLKTDDLAKARAQRDILERADDDYWGALLAGDDTEKALAAYKVAQKRAEALGLNKDGIFTRPRRIAVGSRFQIVKKTHARGYDFQAGNTEPTFNGRPLSMSF